LQYCRRLRPCFSERKSSTLLYHSIARGSLAELETQLRLSKDIGYLSQRDFNVLMDQAATSYKLLNALIKAIQTAIKAPKY
jgi:four helix bundle protein